MSSEYVLELAYLVLITCAKVSAPFMITSLVSGVILNILQTVTSIRDQSVVFIPKVIIAGVVTTLALPWTIEVMLNFFQQVFALIAQVRP